VVKLNSGLVEEGQDVAGHLFRGSPAGAPTWQSRGNFTPLDLRAGPAPWLEYDSGHSRGGLG